MVEQSDGRWVLAGTVSHGIKCAYPDMPGVYMRMTYYKPWIEKITGIKLQEPIKSLFTKSLMTSKKMTTRQAAKIKSGNFATS